MVNTFNPTPGVGLDRPVLCPHFPSCGGCDLIDKPYEEQLAWKQTFCANLFSCFSARQFDNIIPSPETDYYRNKMEFCVGSGSEGLILGQRPKTYSSRVIEVDDCRLFVSNLRRLLGPVLAWAERSGLAAYDVYKRTGEFRYVILRRSWASGEMMAVLVFALTREGFDARQEIFRMLARELEAAATFASVYVCLNKGRADNSITDEVILLCGSPYIRERVGTVEYRVSPQVFLQANTAACEKLYSAIVHAADASGKTVLDLCCGSGGISLQLAGSAMKVVGVDNSAKNIEDACSNAASNRLNNAEFVCSDAEEFLASAVPGSFDVVVLDPPRQPFSRKVFQRLVACSPSRIVYVSCNPFNLRQDLKILTRYYFLERLTPVDMFPHTKHIEVVAALSLK